MADDPDDLAMKRLSAKRLDPRVDSTTRRRAHQAFETIGYGMERLDSMLDAQLRAGKITPARLAELKIAGRRALYARHIPVSLR